MLRLLLLLLLLHHLLIVLLRLLCLDAVLFLQERLKRRPLAAASPDAHWCTSAPCAAHLRLSALPLLLHRAHRSSRHPPRSAQHERHNHRSDARPHLLRCNDACHQPNYNS